MPLYEFKCPECKHVFEDLVTVSKKDEAQTCPKCGDKNARRIMSTFASQGSAKTVSSSGYPGCSPFGG